MSVQKGFAFISPPYGHGKSLTVRDTDLFMYVCDSCGEQWEEVPDAIE